MTVSQSNQTFRELAVIGGFVTAIVLGASCSSKRGPQTDGAPMGPVDAATEGSGSGGAAGQGAAGAGGQAGVQAGTGGERDAGGEREAGEPSPACPSPPALPNGSGCAGFQPGAMCRYPLGGGDAFGVCTCSASHVWTCG